MKNTNEQSKGKTPIFIIKSCTILTSFLIQAFLSGKIIDIPRRTHQGGVIGALGVGIIIMAVIIITLFTRLLINLKNKLK